MRRKFGEWIVADWDKKDWAIWAAMASISGIAGAGLIQGIITLLIIFGILNL